MHIIYIVSGVFLIIYFVMHHADIPFHLGYNSYKFLRTDSTLFFKTRLFFRKSHRDLFSIASNTCFFCKIRGSISTLYQGFFQTDRECLQNAAYERFQSTEHVCGGAFHRNFRKEKLSESSAVVIYRFWDEVRNHLFTVSATVSSIAQHVWRVCLSISPSFSFLALLS